MLCQSCKKDLSVFPKEVFETMKICPFCGKNIVVLEMKEGTVEFELYKILENKGEDILSDSKITLLNEALGAWNAPYLEARELLLLLNYKRIPQRIYATKDLPTEELQKLANECVEEFKYLPIKIESVVEAINWILATLGLKVKAKKEHGNKSFEVKGVKFNMNLVEAGSFKFQDKFDVSLSEDYYIGETQVTQELWNAVMGKSKTDSTKPVGRVSWNDCQKFIDKLNEITGARFRLPTEAEWEYAARGGNKSIGFKFSGSNKLNNVGFYESNSGNEVHPVASLEPNELGLYDMSGNVWEWCQDYFWELKNVDAVDPMGPSSGNARVLRGGSYHSSFDDCSVVARYFRPQRSYQDIFDSVSSSDCGEFGFRLSL